MVGSCSLARETVVCIIAKNQKCVGKKMQYVLRSFVAGISNSSRPKASQNHGDKTNENDTVLPNSPDNTISERGEQH